MKRRSSLPVLVTTVSVVALVGLTTPSFSAELVNNNGGRGIGVSIGGANGINAGAGVSRSNGLGANVNASIGGAGGLNAKGNAQIGGSKAVSSNVSLGIGGANGVNGNGSAQIGGSSAVSSSVSLGIGGASGIDADVDALIGSSGIDADVDVGIGDGIDVGIGGGANLPPQNNAPGDDDNVPPDGSISNSGIAASIESMSDAERRLLKKRCKDVLQSPASYTRDQVTVCRVLAQLAAR
jgi:hypothetical protein